MKDVTPAITLTLLHPLQSVPVQSWPFETESVIRIGRSTDNHVILYSAVVSRHHVELRRNPNGWEIISLGANGTYMDGKRITQMPVIHGMIIRLASSGPKIQIHINREMPSARLKTILDKRASEGKRNINSSNNTLINAESTQSDQTESTEMED
ncbi:MAG: FHA domain-containing protein [Moorea sp. SIO1F2]|uniref:FHA domain-containing protein n=1 Tax=unclassified Moorena TaxID=2683338 RepID=UPI0013BA262C|nr:MULTISPECIES: FHA domain-containing protein [unclassified Moorena]NEO09856.1 FHA domain-containing protein [Moorena sp. SIO3I8]NEP23690.1 FHA domain-containing protein [Moorena sp. SIO3I6]NEO20648.1 FHA domain-containing protein [Moorena sp. SIO4A5]NEQ59084.1 FHA domain-containing protein [Moorena sp. SIO4A1]NET86447.1 FHA domain-containing protein [Moorena sp. SIO1F2]